MPEKLKTVREMKVGERGVIGQLQDPEMALKLLEMGCIPGAEIVMNGRAPLGCPITILVDGYTLSLRREEAGTIILEA